LVRTVISDNKKGHAICISKRDVTKGDSCFDDRL